MLPSATDVVAVATRPDVSASDTGNASPMSYRLRPDARQFVVIAAGGNPLTGPGDALLAFALRTW